MKELNITTKTKVVKKQIEGFQEILAKYRKQRTKIVKKQKELQEIMNACENWNTEEYRQASKDYSNNEKKLTKTNFYIETCEGYRKAWIELYAFNILKDNKEIITQPLYYKKEQARLFKYFDFDGLEFEVYRHDYTSYYNGLTMFDRKSDSRYEGQQLLNEKYLEDLSLMTEATLRYRWQNRYITSENFEDFTKEKYKKIIKIAKKAQKYIDIIEKEQKELGDHFQYKVARLELQHAKDWQKYKRY